MTIWPEHVSPGQASQAVASRRCVAVALRCLKLSPAAARLSFASPTSDTHPGVGVEIQQRPSVVTTIVNMHASIADMTGRRCGETPPAKEKTLNGPNTASSSAIA